jgi:hypothetical protein
MDEFKNGAYAVLSTGYSAGATSVTLTDAGRLPTTFPFNAWYYNHTTYPGAVDDPNYEIVTVNNIVGNVATIARGREGTSASSKNTTGKEYRLVAGLTAKTLNEDIDVFTKVYRTEDSDPVNNSTTLVADDTLKFAVGANEVWAFTLITYWSSATASLKWAFSGPSGATFRAGTDSGSFGTDPTTVDALNAEMSTWHASNPGCVPIHGFISTGATPGTVTFKFAQKAAIAEDTKILEGSYLIAHKMS